MPRDANRDGEAPCATVTRHRRGEDAGRERCLDRGGGGNPAALREGAVALCDAFALQTCFQRLTHKRQPRKPQTRSRRDARCSRVQNDGKGENRARPQKRLPRREGREGRGEQWRHRDAQSHHKVTAAAPSRPSALFNRRLTAVCCCDQGPGPGNDEGHRADARCVSEPDTRTHTHAHMRTHARTHPSWTRAAQPDARAFTLQGGPACVYGFTEVYCTYHKTHPFKGQSSWVFIADRQILTGTERMKNQLASPGPSHTTLPSAAVLPGAPR